MAKIPDLSSQIASLASDDPQVATNAATALLTADLRAYPQDEQGMQNMAAKVAALLSSSSNQALRAAAARLAARMAQQLGTMQRVLKSDAFLAALWSILGDFGSCFSDYKETLTRLMQAPPPPESTKKGGAPKAAPPPPSLAEIEPQLPVPTKQCLDGALRCLTSLATFSSLPAAWLCQNSKPELLVPLLQHHSPRVQLRTVQCMRALSATSAELCARLMVRDLVPELLRLTRASASGAVMAAAVQALLYICQQGPGAPVAQLVELGAVDSLLQLLVAPEAVPTLPAAAASAAAAAAPGGASDATGASRLGTPDPAAVAAAAAAAAAPTVVDYSKLPSCRPQDVQLCSAALLLHLATFSLEAAEQLLDSGAPNLVLAMLPSAPKPAPPPDPLVPAPAPAPAAAAAAAPTPPAAPEPPGPFFPLPPPPPVADEAAIQQDPTALAAGQGAEQQPASEPQPAAEPAPVPPVGVLQKLRYPLPGVRAPTHALQAHLLQLLALMVSEPQAREAVWEAHASGTAALVPFLTYFLVEPEVPLEPVSEAAPVEAPAKGKGKDAKGGKPSSAKGSSKAAAAAEANAPDAPAPPFPSAVRVAAVRCLTQLAQHPGLAEVVRGEEAVRKLVAAAAAAVPGPKPAGEAAPAAAQPGGAVQEQAVAAAAAAAAEPGGAPAAPPAPAPAPPLGAPLADALACLLQLVMAHAAQAGSEAFGSRRELVASVKGLAATAHARGSPVARSNVVRTTLLLSESELIAQARPPPPSPPRTPPPLPLATSQFVWDALGRPNMTDGSNVKLVHL